MPGGDRHRMATGPLNGRLARPKGRTDGKVTAFRPAGQELKIVTLAGDKMAADTICPWQSPSPPPPFRGA